MNTIAMNKINNIVDDILHKYHQPRDHQHFAAIIPAKRSVTAGKDR